MMLKKRLRKSIWIGEDVDGVVGRLGRERHPRASQRVEAAGDIEDGADRGQVLKELRVECVELGQPFVG